MVPSLVRDALLRTSPLLSAIAREWVCRTTPLMPLSTSLPRSPPLLSLSLSFQNLLSQGGGRKHGLKGNFPAVTSPCTLHSHRLPDLGSRVSEHALGRESEGTEGGREGARLARSLRCLDTSTWRSGKLSRLESEIGNSFMLWNWIELLRVTVKIRQGEKVLRTQEQKLLRGERGEAAGRKARNLCDVREVRRCVKKCRQGRGGGCSPGRKAPAKSIDPA